jgi:hypothetical protein
LPVAAGGASVSDPDLVDAVDGLLHAETQVHDGGVDLTSSGYTSTAGSI